MERLRSSWVPQCFGDRLKTGFCLGCGGKTRYVKDQRKLTGKQGDTVNWHPACYTRFSRMWRKELYREGQRRRCAVCRKVFIAAGRGAYRKILCSEGCRREWQRRADRVREKRHDRRPLPRQRRACLVCGKRFLVGGGLAEGTKRTCSPACRKEWKRRATAARLKAHPRPLKVHVLGYQRTCVICGESFTIESPREWRRNACSPDCRTERNRRRGAVWRKANREHVNETRRNYSYQRYHSDPVYRKKLVDYAALRRARLIKEGRTAVRPEGRSRLP